VIDVHNHLLPGLDDGPEDIEETLKMCRMAVEDGIHCIVATPHCFDGRFHNRPETIRSAVKDLTAKLESLGIDLIILPGMEVRIMPELIQFLKEGKVLPLNRGKYVLLEFHHSQLPAGFDKLVQRFLSAGFHPVLAHLEKNGPIQSNPGYIFNLLNTANPWDILIQVSADSITGEAGFWAKRTAKILLKYGLVHLIATDAHSFDRRAPRLSAAVEAASAIVGKKRARQLVEDIPRAVIDSDAFPDMWDLANPRRWWRIL